MSGLMALESSCAPNAGSEGSIDNIYETRLDFSPPSPRSLSEAAPPYSPVGSYPPPVNSPARFPPPPNSDFPQTHQLNMTFFEGQPAPHYHFDQPTSEPLAPYDHWPERSVSSVCGYGSDSSSKYVSNWPLPSANYIGNSKYSTTTSEPLYPTIATSPPYPLSDSRSKPFTSRISSSVHDYQSTVSPSATVPSTSASVSSPHFASSSPRTARPQFSSRFSFNPHASAFYPGMCSQTSYGLNEDFLPYHEPSYISHLAPTDFLSNSPQVVDSFHDTSSRPVRSPETAPRPISSTAPSFFSGVHSFSGCSATFSNPIAAPQPLSRTDYCGLTSSSDGSGVRVSSCDFPPVSALSFEMPVPRASVATPYVTTATIPLSCQLKRSEAEEDDTMERVVKESGNLLYRQHISPEEWRWNIYEAQIEALNVEGLIDLADCTQRSYCSTYNYFQGVERIGPSCVTEAVGGNSNSLFAVSVVERSRLQNQGGPSLKLAASALAEMLASSSAGQSTMAHTASFPPTAPSLPVDFISPIMGDSGRAFQLPRFEERPQDDCCSSSGSVAFVKEANDASATGVDDSCGPHSSCIPVESERGNVGRIPVNLVIPDTSRQSQGSTTARPLSTLLFNVVPQVGATHGHRSFVNDASGGSSQTAPVSSTGLNLETSENQNLLFTQTLGVSPDTDSGKTRRVTTQPVGAVSSEDDSSVEGPLRASLAGIDLSTSGPCHDLSSIRVERQVPRSGCQNMDSSRGSVLTGISLPSSEVPADSQVLGSVPPMADEEAAKLLASFNLPSPQTMNTGQTVPTHYSGLQLLTGSISNLTKVLLKTHSLALPQSDIAPLQESLQTSILRLSECLLLEQAKVNQQSGDSTSAGPRGLKDSAGQDEAPSDDSLNIFDLKCHGGAHYNSDRSNMKSSEGGPSEEARPLSTSTGNDITGVKVGANKTSVAGNGSQKNIVLRENVDDVTEHFQEGGSAASGRSNSTTSSDPTNTFQLQRGEMNYILDYLREQDLVDLPALKKLLAAEQREEELKVVIQDLTEQLEFEREESRGTAFLYEKMQEADLHMSRLQKKSFSPGSGKVQVVSPDTVGCYTSTSPSLPVLMPAQPSTSDGMGAGAECLRTAIGSQHIHDSIVKGYNKGDCDRMAIEKTEVEYPSIELEYSDLDGLEARLALLRGRHGRNREEEVLTDTGSFTLQVDSPGPSYWTRLEEGVNGSSSLGLQDEQLTTYQSPSWLTSHMLKTPEAVSDMNAALTSQMLERSELMTNMNAQMLKTSEVLSNMNAAWNKGYDYLGSEYEGMESREAEREETQTHSVTQSHDNSLSIEARTLIIRSRSSWAENDRLDSDDEIFNGDLESGISVFSKSEDSRLGTVREGSYTSLGVLVNSEVGHREEDVARHRSPRPERENGVGCMLDSLSSDKEAVKNIIQSQDSEEESGWEHVRLPRQVSK